VRYTRYLIFVFWDAHLIVLHSHISWAGEIEETLHEARQVRLHHLVNDDRYWLFHDVHTVTAQAP
jgi:hypothetical protein